MQSVTSPTSFSQVQQLEVGPERDGQRVDNCLSALLKGVPRSMIYRLLRTGQVRINGKRAKPDTRLNVGDTLRIPPVRLEVRETGEAPRELVEKLRQSIIFEDKHYLVIDKPTGIASHGGSGISHGAIELMRAARPDEHLELVHRLDRDTSGVLVMARTRQGLVGLQNLIREGRVTKQYLALLTGKIKRQKFDVNVPLRKFVLQGGERMVRVSDDGKPALTFFKELERYPSASLMQVTLGSGRTHQIRVHSAHIGHPVAGDPKYGDREANKRLQGAGLHRLFLHAARFEFELGERSYCFSTPLPDELRACLDRLA
ncbi:MAG TPA: RluA family pseudouridine synthase [Rhodanobacteraceae bacterium]